MLKFLIKFIDKNIDAYLEKNHAVFSLKMVKFIAFYYPNAKIRKIYLSKLGLIMGENTYSNFGLKFTMNDDCSPSVIIGNNVSIGPNVTFLPNSSPNNSDLLKNIPEIKNKLVKEGATIHVGDDAWLGCGCIIMPGITIGKGCIIGASAVVTKDTEDFSIYAGVPAAKIRTINNEQ